METYYAMIDGNVTEIRVPRTEVRNNRWEGYVVGKTVTELMTVGGGTTVAEKVLTSKGAGYTSLSS